MRGALACETNGLALCGACGGAVSSPCGVSSNDGGGGGESGVAQSHRVCWRAGNPQGHHHCCCCCCGDDGGSLDRVGGS